MMKSQRLELRLAPGDIALLDDLRGPSTRSAYIRALLHRQRGHRESVEEVPARVPTPVTAEPSIISGSGPGKATGVPPKRHWHRYVPDKKPVEVRNGMDVYILRCEPECGETREELRPRKIHP